jgi:hypothetical protein
VTRLKSPEKDVSFVPTGSTTEHLQVTVVEDALDAFACAVLDSPVALQPSVIHSSRSSDHREHQNSWSVPPDPFPDTVLTVCVVFPPHASVR